MANRLRSTLTLLLLGAALVGTARASVPNLAVDAVFKLLENAHPESGKPVFERDGIDRASLNLCLDAFSSAYAQLPSNARETVAATYLDQILTLPFRVGWQAAHYMPLSFVSRDKAPRILIGSAVATRVILETITTHFNDFTTADTAHAVGRPHLRLVIQKLASANAVADLIAIEPSLNARRADLIRSGVEPSAFVAFVVDLGLELARGSSILFKDARVHQAIQGLAAGPARYGHAEAAELERDRTEILLSLACRDALFAQFPIP